MSKFVENLSGEFANNWLIRALSPSFVFWAVGFLALTGGLRNINSLQNALDPFVSQNETHWIILLLLAFIWITAWAWVAEQITLPVTRLLEGYWPNIFGFWQWRIKAAGKKWEKSRNEWAELSKLSSPTPAETRRKILLDHTLRHCPSTPNRLLPTQLGNILCASETWPIDKYGLDVVICWPRLWLLLPDKNREDIAAARAAMDNGVRLVLWGTLSLIWSIWVYWLLPVSLIIIFVCYRATLSAAIDFADLVEAAFDTRRILLYSALGWPLPKSPAEEKALGEALTKYLYRGSDDTEPEFKFSVTAAPT